MGLILLMLLMAAPDKYNQCFDKCMDKYLECTRPCPTLKCSDKCTDKFYSCEDVCYAKKTQKKL